MPHKLQNNLQQLSAWRKLNLFEFPAWGMTPDNSESRRYRDGDQSERGKEMPAPATLSLRTAWLHRSKSFHTTSVDFVFLGSPRSNPWTSMFDPILDFQFVFDNLTQREFVHNVRRRKGESSDYIPTAGGFDTGAPSRSLASFTTPAMQAAC